MSGEAPLAMPIEGYTISVFKSNTEKGDVILEQDLKLNKVGGAHVTNADDLIMMIEDAVFNYEAD
jgi:hypothetical protein